MGKCPICKLNDEKVVLEKEGPFGKRIICPRCIKFTIPFYPEFAKPDRLLGPKLSAWLRYRNEQSVEVPEINPHKLEDLQKGLPNYGPREKQVILLQNIERKTEYPGKPVQIDPDYDIPLAWASAKEEFMYYIDSLIERGLLRNVGRGEKVHRNLSNELIYNSAGFSVEITAAGWDYLEQRETHIEERTQAFVAMSFAKELKPIWEGPIYNAIVKSGYKPFRVDAKPHSDRIDAKIIAEIKNSRFLLADVTKHRQGVYFEAGYALGLGLPVIWSVRKDHCKKVHFDTRQYNHIIWETMDYLEDQLYNFICAIIGKGKGD
jgi:nucleoside 2-deoxyribosyltransferase